MINVTDSDSLGLWMKQHVMDIQPYVSLEGWEEISKFIHVGEYDLAFESAIFNMLELGTMPQKLVAPAASIIKARKLIEKAEHPEIAAYHQKVLNRVYTELKENNAIDRN